MATPPQSWFVICLLLALGAPAPRARARRRRRRHGAEPQPAPDPNAPRIAPPAPEASPQDVEDAEVDRQEAALTPIVPSPKNPLRPAFQLYAEIDLPVLGIGLVFAEARAFRVEMALCAPLCDPSTLNSRRSRRPPATGAPAGKHASDYGLYAIGLGAGALLFVDEGLLSGSQRPRRRRRDAAWRRRRSRRS